MGVTTAFALCVTSLPGCNWFTGADETVKLTKVRPPAVRLRPPPPALSSGIPDAAQSLSSATTADDAARGFSDLAAQDPPFGRALTNAVCAGMEQLGSLDDDDTTGDNWRDFLIGQVTAQLPALPVVEKVDGLLNTWDLAQVHAGLARVYFQGCVARG